MSGSTPVAMVVARELRVSLARRRMSHADLERACSLPHTTVNRALRGEEAISLDTYVAIVSALSGGSPQELTGRLVGEIRRRTPLVQDLDAEEAGR